MKEVINKRAFPRRKLDLTFDLIVNGQAVSAVATDFSPTGIAIFIKGMSELNSQVLDLKIRDINLNASGKIIWKREMFAGLKVGVIRMGPLEGMLGYYRLSDLLSGIQRARKSGVLHIETEQSHRKIYFKDGEMVFSLSDPKEEPPGAMLRASEPQDLVQAAHQSAASVIMNLCTAEDAKFIFREEPLPGGEIIQLNLNTSDLLYRGARKAECIDAFKRRYLPHHTTVSISSDISSILDRLVLEARDKEILSLINAKVSLSEILAVSPSNEEDTLRAVYALFSARLLEMEAETAGESPQEHMIAPEGTSIDPGLAERIDKIYHEHKTLGYQGVLGLLPGATSSEIKHAYHALAKEYHPDRYLFVQSGELKEKLNVIFAYINEAYRELSRSGSSSQQQTQTAAPQAEPQGTNNKTMAQGKYRQGRQSLNNQDNENAMTFLGQAVYLDDSVPDYHFFYGIALLRNKKIKEAEASILKAVSLSPHNADYVAELGHIYLKLGFMLRAKNTFDKALKINPHQADAAEGMKKIVELQKD
ncbi:MAG: DUF4388 domain-containing protein [Nitrospirae bacterium]|nr:DUF4388 domain-containing protein [Nitrospirota bacterium]